MGLCHIETMSWRSCQLFMPAIISSLALASVTRDVHRGHGMMERAKTSVFGTSPLQFIHDSRARLVSMIVNVYGYKQNGTDVAM